ncbi:helix-turn-helix domain-containing protein [Sphingomonas ginsenosidimutans]|jgi:transcriptional regulator with XRE-family HTH domain|uniref:helix-turn-helix domain-containing protein n=1 Tax=Sphingomonas ginsenosidimutans TaxID=862134 RepID=UPI001E105BE6|nr:helix-turn-helix transcriptional regulator [Sphingomonas ginsenosidimutans]MBY0301265.1 helix-turn-helix domain-containing protein [Sphingomonas ginsenosidimutans]
MAYILAMHPANRVRELRKAAKLSQSDLAQRTGVSQPFISQIENQDGLTLDIARMRSLAREFGCFPADLLTDDDNPDRLTPDERRLLANYRRAEPSQRLLIERVAEPLTGEVDTGDRRAA